jgi:hypothetical protein
MLYECDYVPRCHYRMDDYNAMRSRVSHPVTIDVLVRNMLLFKVAVISQSCDDAKCDVML